jgi:hypothetical protein
MEPIPNVEPSVEQLRKRIKKILVAFTTVALVLAAALVCLAFFTWRKSKAIDRAVEDAAYYGFAVYYTANSSLVTPQVNTIQFVRHGGYSIDFDSVKYTQDGLALTGTVGNATQLSISSLALNFTARPYPRGIREKWRDKWHQNHLVFWDDAWDIGTGQVTIGLLNPGSSAPFTVTIPNVKQTSDQIQIEVEFTGERYQYLK